MKKNRMLTCMVAGVTLLSVSAFAAFGSVGGYGQYKQAVKALVLDTDNVSYNASFTVKVDGQEVTKTTLDGKLDGANRQSHSKTDDMDYGDGYNDEYWNSVVNGTEIWFYDRDEDNCYYEDKNANTDRTTLLGLEQDDEMNRRIITFAEMAMDTVVGDLKNNFVQTASEKGSKTYVVDISENQVPPLVNAGLSLAAYSIGLNNNYLHTIYEDYEHTNINYFEKQTGKTLSDEMKAYLFGNAEEEEIYQVYTDAWYEEHEDELNEYWEVVQAIDNDLYEKYDTGYAYVNLDGSTNYYATADEFYVAHPEEMPQGADIFDDGSLIGKDASLKQVRSEFTVDKNGNLTKNTMDVTFETVDTKGQNHTIVITVDATLYDYGTTTVEHWDTGDRTKHTFDDNEVYSDGASTTIKTIS